MNKEQMLKLMAQLTLATIKNYEVTNGIRKGGLDAADREFRAAKTLLLATGHSATDDEIAKALGWQ